MKQRFYLVAATLLLQLGLAAQSKYKFTSINQGGMIVGASNGSYLLQTINGVSYKTFSAGVGVGIDNYYVKTIPLFLDVRKTFGKKKFQPFTYIDAGADLRWKKTDNENMYVYDGEYHKGFYLDAGAGYSMKIKKLGAVLLSVGYTRKTMKESSNLYPMIDPLPTPYTSETLNTTYNYVFNRLTMKVGLRF